MAVSVVSSYGTPDHSFKGCNSEMVFEERNNKLVHLNVMYGNMNKREPLCLFVSIDYTSGNTRMIRCELSKLLQSKCLLLYACLIKRVVGHVCILILKYLGWWRVLFNSIFLSTRIYIPTYNRKKTCHCRFSISFFF